jgi:hypothetical protein
LLVKGVPQLLKSLVILSGFLLNTRAHMWGAANAVWSRCGGLAHCCGENLFLEEFFFGGKGGPTSL